MEGEKQQEKRSLGGSESDIGLLLRPSKQHSLSRPKGG